MEILNTDDGNFSAKKSRPYWKILCLVVLVWMLFIGALKYNIYDKGLITSDVVLYANILWNTGGHDILFSDMFYDWFGYTTFLNEHFAPTLLILSIFYKIFPHVLSLIFLQTFVNATAALLLFYLGKKVLKSDFLAFIISLGYLFHPALVSATIDNVYGFQHDTFFLPLFMLLAIFYFEKKFVPFIISLTLLVGLKENMALAGIIGGLILLLFGNKKFGGFTVLISAAMSFIGLWLVPHFSGVANRHAMDVLANLANFNFLYGIERFAYWSVLLLLLPAILAPEILIFAAPDLFLYFTTYRLPFDHYVFFVFSVFSVAAVFGMKKFLDSERLKNIFLKKKVLLWGVVAILVSGFIVGNIKVAGRYVELLNKFSWRKVNLSAMNEIKTKIPTNVCLVTSSDIAAYFVNRQCLSFYHLSLPTADYVLINKSAGDGFEYDKVLIEETARMEKEQKLMRVNDFGGFVLLQKKP